jgi:hypothetical protein
VPFGRLRSQLYIFWLSPFLVVTLSGVLLGVDAGAAMPLTMSVLGIAHPSAPNVPENATAQCNECDPVGMTWLLGRLGG